MLLGIVAIVVLIGVYAMSGKTDSQSSAGASVAASSVMSDAQAISQTAQTIAIQQTTTVASEMFSPAAANNSTLTNIIATSSGSGMQDPTPPAQALRTSSALTAVEGYYVFMPNGTGAGGVGGFPAVALAGVTDAVCKAYMSNIYGSSASNPGPQPLGIAAATYLGAITSATPTVATAVATSLAVAPKGVCYTTTDGPDHNIIIYLM